MSVAAVVLAAGSSSRLGHPKQAVVYLGETLLGRAVRFASHVADEVIVVSNVPLVLDVRVVVNEHASEGIASSIRAGVTAARDASRILITLCDQPLVTDAHLRALLTPNAPIVATGYAGIAGVPAVFTAPYFDELCALRGDRGARAVIEAHRDAVAVIPFEAAAVDIDTEADVEKLQHS